MNNSLKTEGIHLVAYVRVPGESGATMIEDNDYNSKKEFERELRANGYSVLSINDNRDLYLMDRTNYTKMSQLENDVRMYKRWWEESKKRNPDSTTFKDEYERLKALYDEAKKQPLTESAKLSEEFSYLCDEDKPKYNDYIGLNMQIDGTKTKIKVLQAKINKDKYSADKNKHLYKLNYYKELLSQYENALKNTKNLKEGTSIKAKYKPMVKDFYKTPTGTWMIDLNDGYVTSYGTNYIERDTKSDCIYELENFVTPYNYIHSDKDTLNENSSENSDSITLYHNTTNENAVKINKEGIKAGTRLSVYGKGSEAEGAGIWCTTKRGFGYGGATITFSINKSDKDLVSQNDTEYILYRDVLPSEILDIDLQVIAIPTQNGHNTMESEVPMLLKKFGMQKTLDIFKKYENKFISPYDYYKFLNLVESGKKLCRGTINLTESKHSNNLKQKLIEVSRNELLAKAKLQTITRYEKSSGYKGFSIADIDTTSVFTRDVLRVTCRVGNYWDTIELDNILYWVQLEAEKNPRYQINTKGVTAAIMNAADGMDIKVDCTCADFKYRFAYMATKLGYKYGKPETRPANITNPNNYGSMCKHLISMLSNKRWLRQVTSVFMDFLEDRIDDVNRFLKPREGEELTLPNELARQNAKKGFYSKLFKDNEDEVEDNNTEVEANETNSTDSKEDIEDNNKDTNSSSNT